MTDEPFLAADRLAGPEAVRSDEKQTESAGGSATEPFGMRLAAAMQARGPLCVGIDPHPGLLRAWELEEDAEGLSRFCDICVSTFGAEAAVVKPQAAFFEVFGANGMAVLQATVHALRASGALVVLDVKRGDIGSTMAAYARAYLDPAGPLASDAITLSPYLGVASLRPAFDMAHAHGAGTFVLALTSNPERDGMQLARTSDDRTVAQGVVDEVAQLNAGSSPLGSHGVVIGATVTSGAPDLSGLNGPILVPGVGAQGGTASDVERIFGGVLRQVLPSVSRDVLRCGPGVTALRDAVRRLADDFAFLRS